MILGRSVGKSTFVFRGCFLFDNFCSFEGHFFRHISRRPFGISFGEKAIQHRGTIISLGVPKSVLFLICSYVCYCCVVLVLCFVCSFVAS